MGTKNNPGEFDCYANAEPDEPMFVLLARDPLAPRLVEMWAALHAESRNTDESGMAIAQAVTPNAKEDEALRCASQMRVWRKINR